MINLINKFDTKIKIELCHKSMCTPLGLRFKIKRLEEK